MTFPAEGGCACGAVRYRLKKPPLFVQCCHCTWCQRETGSAFVINAMIEAREVETLAAAPEEVPTPSASGAGQIIHRCPTCHVALWSVYSGAGPLFRFVRVGTLDDPSVAPPQAWIYTSTRQPWLPVPEGMKVFEEYYQRSEHWPAESLARRQAVIDGA